MKTKFLIIALAATLAACSDDQPETNLPLDPETPQHTAGLYVLNQGSYYSMIEGSLSYVTLPSLTATQNVFSSANGRSLGATPQCGVAHGGKIYIGVYESNTIEVIDRYTLKSIKQISLKDETGQNPRGVIAYKGKVYMTMYNGYVCRLDTASLSIDATVQVGPNPEIPVLHNGKIFVPNSDGMNWEVGYGNTASVIDLASFQVEQTITTGLNPTKFASDGTNLFVLCMGDYGATPAQVYRVDNSLVSHSFAEATMMDVKDGKVYCINAPYMADPTYKVYDAISGLESTMVTEGVDYPAGLAVSHTGEIVITSYVKEGSWASYNTDGYVAVYDNTGKRTGTAAVGVNPVTIFMNAY